MADLEIRISAKDMGADGALKNLQQAAGRAEGSLDSLGGTADRASRKISDGGRSSDEAAGRLDRVGDSADETEGKFTGLASGIDGVTSLMDDPSPQEFAQGLADIADGVGNFLIPTLKMLSVEMVKNVANTARSAAANAGAAASVVAGWVAAGATAVVNAALVVAGWIAAAAQAAVSAAAMALSWLIAMGPAIIIIALVMGAIALLIIHWDTVKEVALKVWDAIWNAIKAVWDWISNNWPLILAIITGPIGMAVLIITKNWDTIKDAFGAAIQFIKDRASDVKQWIVDRFNDVVGFFQGLPGRISSIASGMWNGLKDSFRNTLNSIISLWNNISFTLPKIKIPSVDVPGLGKIGGGEFGGQTFSTPNVPLLASGGTRSGLVGVGERGMELVDLGAGGSVIGANRSSRMMREQNTGPAPTVIYLTIEGSVRSDRDLVKMIAKEIDGGAIPGLTRRTA